MVGIRVYLVAKKSNAIYMECPQDICNVGVDRELVREICNGSIQIVKEQFSIWISQNIMNADYKYETAGVCEVMSWILYNYIGEDDMVEVRRG